MKIRAKTRCVFDAMEVYYSKLIGKHFLQCNISENTFG